MANMIQKEKESLFDLLRTYHQTEVPTKFAGAEMGVLSAELTLVQDKVISMVLGFVYGRSEFVDWTPQLKNLAGKVEGCASGTDLEEVQHKVVTAKVYHLLQVVGFTQKLNLTPAV